MSEIIEMEQSHAAIVPQQGPAANSPMGMMMAAARTGISGKRIDQLISRVAKSFDLAEWFSYDPDTGIVSWKKSPSTSIKQGRAAGTPCGKGSKKYWNIKFRGGYILAHHVAFFLSFGRLPTAEVDHIDGDGLNNRLKNLREATHASNMKNMRMNSRNTSGIAGVHFNKKVGRWESTICANGKRIFLGNFNDKSEAASARKQAERTLGFHKNHGRTA